MLETLLRGAQQLGISLTTQQTEQFHVYYQQLLAWNDKVNLTSITEYEDVQTRHFVDSLSIVPVLIEERRSGSGFSLIDVGTGAGFPGIPLKIALPGIRVVLLESVGKKTAFLKYMLETLGLSDTEVVTGRAEDVARKVEYREKFAVVAARAVGRLPTLVELTLPFCREGGLLIAPKKGNIDAELRQATRAIDLLGGSLKEVKQMDMAGLKGHCLVIIEKVAATPERYPRRAGIPSKRPL